MRVVVYIEGNCCVCVQIVMKDVKVGKHNARQVEVGWLRINHGR